MNIEVKSFKYEVPNEDFLFVSTAMSHRADRNIPALREALAVLRDIGYVVWSPYQSYNPGDDDPNGIVADVLAVTDDNCTGVIALPGWEGSLGAKLEVLMAAKLDKPVYHYDKELIAVFSLAYFRFIPRLNS